MSQVSCMSHMYLVCTRVRKIVLSLAGHFKLFAGHLIGFNYSSSPDIFKSCWTCPANFAYSDVHICVNCLWHFEQFSIRCLMRCFSPCEVFTHLSHTWVPLALCHMCNSCYFFLHWCTKLDATFLIVVRLQSETIVGKLRTSSVSKFAKFSCHEIFLLYSTVNEQNFVCN